jgi:hypothetical protein
MDHDLVQVVQREPSPARRDALGLGITHSQPVGKERAVRHWP